MRAKKKVGDTKIATAVATRLSLIKHSRDHPLAVPFHSNLSNYTIASRSIGGVAAREIRQSNPTQSRKLWLRTPQPRL